MRRVASVLVALAAVAAVSLACSACGDKQNANGPGDAAGEWKSGPVDLRKLTTLIKVTPPRALRETFESIAARAKDESLSRFFRAFASGGSGSGFVMVRAVNGRDEEFVITNKHVVQIAEDAEIGFATGMSFSSCEIVYTDPNYDLAILAFPQGQRPIAYGLRPAAAPAKDRQTVVATGFPELGGKPSYQTTEGKVSNAEFVFDDEGGAKITFIQHTAPIDPGSSGGPLTSENGELLGVNTMFLRNKHSAFFAVPARAVEQAVRAAFEIKQKRESSAWRKEQLVKACKVFVSELESDDPKIDVIDDLISNHMVAEKGFESFKLVANNRAFLERFVEDPMDGMRKALLLRILFRIKSKDMGGGLAAGNSCADIAASDEQKITTAQLVRMKLKLENEVFEIKWTFEHGHWRLAGGEFGEASGPSDTPQPPKAPPKTPPTTPPTDIPNPADG
jgi:serine protease Do